MNTTLSKILVGFFGVHSSKKVAGVTQPQIGDIVQYKIFEQDSIVGVDTIRMDDVVSSSQPLKPTRR